MLNEQWVLDRKNELSWLIKNDSDYGDMCMVLMNTIFSSSHIELFRTVEHTDMFIEELSSLSLPIISQEEYDNGIQDLTRSTNVVDILNDLYDEWDATYHMSNQELEYFIDSVIDVEEKDLSIICVMSVIYEYPMFLIVVILMEKYNLY